jgi:bacillolysin
MQLSIMRLLIIAMLILCSVIGYAQEDTLEIKRDANGKIAFVAFDAEKNNMLKMSNGINIIRSGLKATSNDEFRLVDEFQDENGGTHKKYYQYYQGIRVEYADYLVHGKGENITSMNGEYFPINISSINPSLSEKEALTKALNFVASKKYAWEDQTFESKVESSKSLPKGELVICKEFLKRTNELKLSWKFKIISLNPDDAVNIFVDANNGEIINKELLICNVNAPGTVESTYSGTRSITGDSFVGGFRLRETRSSVDVQTLNMQQTANYAGAIDFVDNNNAWTAAEFANPNRDQAALDAHWATEITLDYWKSVGRNSYNGSNGAVRNYVHYMPAGRTVWNNAQWDPSNNVMRFGDGDGFIFRPLTSLDIYAHEFGHGVCQFTANLAYVLAESSALNEGFSDIWGAVVENYGAPAKQPWVMGEDITLVAPGFFRSLSNPQNGLEGRVDTYNGANWYVGPDVDTYSHSNLSVLTHWFFLLSMGGAGWNNGQTSHGPVGTGFQWTVTGIGINSAASIAYLTERTINSTANYTMVRNMSIQAARTLFGTNSCQEVAVTNAWFAVGVGAAYTGVPIPTITGAQKFCSGSQIYTVSPGTVATWTPSIPTGVATFTTAGNNLTLTRSASGNGFVNLTANITNACNSGFAGVATLTNIAVGFPTFTDTIVGTKIATPNGQHNYTLVLPSRYPSVSYNWSVTPSPGWTIMTGQGTNTVKIKVNTVSGSLNVDVTACGVNRGKFATIAVGSGGGSPDFTDPGGINLLRASPNPATTTTTVSLLPGNKLKATSKITIQEVRITDKIGNLKRQLKFKGGQASQTIDVSSLPSDVYAVSVYDGITWHTTKIIVQ